MSKSTKRFFICLSVLTITFNIFLSPFLYLVFIINQLFLFVNCIFETYYVSTNIAKKFFNSFYFLVEKD